MQPVREILWRKSASLYLEKAIDYIREDSQKNADTVANAILILIDKAALNPEHFPADKFKRDNKGAFRAFEVYSFRISFYVSNAFIRIVRVRHTKQKPLAY